MQTKLITKVLCSSIKPQTIITFLLSIFAATSTLNLHGCSKGQKGIKTIIGTYAEWENPFELRMIEEQDSTFKGIVKWNKNDCWTYIQGQYFGKDSLVFSQLDNAMGFGIVLNDQWPAKIHGDSISGKWLHPSNQASGNPYQGKIIEQGPPLSEIEKEVWKLYKKEKTLKIEHANLQTQIFDIWRQSREKKQDVPFQTDSLESLRGKYAIRLINSFDPVYKKFIYGIDSTLINKELSARLHENFKRTKLDSLQKSQIIALIKQNPEGSVIYYRLNRILHEQKLRELRFLPKGDFREAYSKEKREFLLKFFEEDMHPFEELSYLFDFAHTVYQNDPTYYTALMEKVHRLKEKTPENLNKYIEKLFSIINRIDRESSLSVGTLAPDFSAKTLKGQDIKLSSFKGKVVCLEFWASWCGPCRTSTPKLKEIQKQFSENLVMIGIALEDSSSAKKYINENEIDWLNIATEEKDKWFMSLYGINGVPTMFLIDKQGKVAHRLHPLDKELKKKIEDLI